jgi:hypothetical protein
VIPDTIFSDFLVGIRLPVIVLLLSKLATEADAVDAVSGLAGFSTVAQAVRLAQIANMAATYILFITSPSFG